MSLTSGFFGLPETVGDGRADDQRIGLVPLCAWHLCFQIFFARRTLNILLTNDDGWDAVGLTMLGQVAQPLGRLVVVAPQAEQSGISHQLTLNRPIEMVQQSADRYRLNGTPADCVRIALTQLGIRFDWVLSGVNDGGNLGSDVYVSGTVAAAREAQLHGIRSMALSQYRKRYSEPFDWQNLVPMLDRVLNAYVAGNRSPAADACLINVNFPDVAPSLEPTEMVECELDPNPLPSGYEATPEGYVYTSRYRDRRRTDGCDVDVCFRGQIAISRL